MQKIASFTVNHLDLLPGVYVSRRDSLGMETLTTYDLRMTAPNKEPVIHATAFLPSLTQGIIVLRNHPDYKDRVIYFGPMGCRTGFYLILNGDQTSSEILGLVTETFEFIRDFEGEVPGASPKDCGNYLDMNLPMAKFLADKYLTFSLYKANEKNLNYPE